MKHILVIVFCLAVVSLFGQSGKDELAKVKTIDAANELIRNHPDLEARLFSIASDNDTSDITMPLFEKKVGYTFSIDKYTYKIIASDTYPSFRASYIYLDGSQLTIHEIDSLRSVIISQYKSGTPFRDLVTGYTMDGNPTGDLWWFTEGKMVKEFETAVRQHKQNDIFTVDIAYNKWYYVVLKTFNDRTNERLTLLRIKSSK